MLRTSAPLIGALGLTDAPMKYDDASWHYGGSFPEGQPDEHAGTHIGLFLRWCFAKGWAGQLHTDEEPNVVDEVVRGNMTGTEFLFRYCDGKFTDEDLSEEGNTFSERYYGDDGLYLDDYAEHFGELMYVAPESAHDYHQFATMLQARLSSNILTKSQAKS